MQDIRIVLLVGKGESSRIVYHTLKQFFRILAVIEENKVSSWQTIQKRTKRLGIFKVLGQLAFLVYIRTLKKFSLRRINQIKQQYHLHGDNYPTDIFVSTESINDPWVAKHLNELKPDVIVVNGTRIIQEELLKSVPIHLINIHVGLTPRYRGVHGAYWALAEKNPEQCGVTIHLIDKGIDTGGILFQALIKPINTDNFLTYPYLQLAAGLPLLRQAILDVAASNYKIIDNKLSSKYYSHPTLLQYLKNYLVNGVK